VVFIGSDTSKQNLGEFIRQFPDRFFMEGVYEANLIGVAAGMALSGKIPYLNTIATFLSRRCYEQVVIDLGLHNLPVRLLASGGGTVYAPLGPTHLATDDFALMRAVPNMAVVAPCDAEEMARLMPLTLAWPGPMYIRIAKGGDPIVSRPDLPFRIGSGLVMEEGRDILLVSTGVTAQVILQVRKNLAAQGISATVLHLPTLKPLDREVLMEQAWVKKGVFTVEEHSLVGGLGSAVAEVLLESGWRGKSFYRFALPDTFMDELGSQAEIMGAHGIRVDFICQKIQKMLR
jgi:transketolase